MLGEITGNIHVGLAGLGSAIGVALVGMKASEAVGRNPGAFGKIITLAVLGMALSEAIVFYAIYLAH
ncbi:MAG TPA: ATP synthase F0 subunit C [Candidatus Baltobacteraceae bacterium]|nr:ATP synthase F0 subunit C [Candidatus Baltobacteraceae bacterium]